MRKSDEEMRPIISGLHSTSITAPQDAHKRLVLYIGKNFVSRL